jgi:hypothetical protein
VTKEAVLAFLASLNERQFVEIVSAACKERRSEKSFDDGFEIEAFSLSHHAFGKFRGVMDSAPDTEHCATIHPEVADVEWTDGLCQSGRCHFCHARVTSVAKLALCPICLRQVECT